jgi:hypothetical protein
MSNLQERIVGLEEQLRVLKARQQRLIARERKLTAQRERREDTRRKILIGAMILEHIEQGRYSREALKAALDRFLTREADRALFELPVGSSASAASGHPEDPAPAARSARRGDGSMASDAVKGKPSG